MTADTIKEISLSLGIKINTLKQWVLDGKLRVKKLPNGWELFARSPEVQEAITEAHLKRLDFAF